MAAMKISLFVAFVLFPLAGALTLRKLPSPWNRRAFALINVFGLFALCVCTNYSDRIGRMNAVPYLRIVGALCALYLGLVTAYYFVLRRFGKRSTAAPLLLPILALIVLKYTPVGWHDFSSTLGHLNHLLVVEFFLGISYMAFRLSSLSVELANGVVPFPTLSEYLSFAFFVPTLSVGPINPYSHFHRSLNHPDESLTPLPRSLSRMLVGAVKFVVLGNLFNQLSYSGLMLDAHPHPTVDLIIAAVAFYFYLYLNFSGYCDMAIGAAGLLKIHVHENFDNPFGSRNVKEFWNRWHITLSLYTRDALFSPLSKSLARIFGAGGTNHAIALTIIIVFLVIGVWHGVGVNFALYGLAHGLAVAGNHYYTVWLKKRLGRDGFRAYQENVPIRWAATALTFAFVTATLFLLANDVKTASTILASVQP